MRLGVLERCEREARHIRNSYSMHTVERERDVG